MMNYLLSCERHRYRLSQADLSGALLSGALLSGANLSGAKLLMTNLSGAKLLMTNLSGANISHSVLISIEPQNYESMRLNTKTNFEYAICDNVDFIYYISMFTSLENIPNIVNDKKVPCCTTTMALVGFS